MAAAAASATSFQASNVWVCSFCEQPFPKAVLKRKYYDCLHESCQKCSEEIQKLWGLNQAKTCSLCDKGLTPASIQLIQSSPKMSAIATKALGKEEADKAESKEAVAKQEKKSNKKYTLTSSLSVLILPLQKALQETENFFAVVDCSGNDESVGILQIYQFFNSPKFSQLIDSFEAILVGIENTLTSQCDSLKNLLRENHPESAAVVLGEILDETIKTNELLLQVMRPKESLLVSLFKQSEYFKHTFEKTRILKKLLGRSRELLYLVPNFSKVLLMTKLGALLNPLPKSAPFLEALTRFCKRDIPIRPFLIEHPHLIPSLLEYLKPQAISSSDREIFSQVSAAFDCLTHLVVFVDTTVADRIAKQSAEFLASCLTAIDHPKLQAKALDCIDKITVHHPDSVQYLLDSAIPDTFLFAQTKENSELIQKIQERLSLVSFEPPESSVLSGLEEALNDENHFSSSTASFAPPSSPTQNSATYFDELKSMGFSDKIIQLVLKSVPRSVSDAIELACAFSEPETKQAPSTEKL